MFKLKSLDSIKLFSKANRARRKGRSRSKSEATKKSTDIYDNSNCPIRPEFEFLEIDPKKCFTI